MSRLYTLDDVGTWRVIFTQPYNPAVPPDAAFAAVVPNENGSGAALKVSQGSAGDVVELHLYDNVTMGWVPVWKAEGRE